MDSVWKKDDCLHQVLPDMERPDFLDTTTSEQALAKFKKMHNGDIKAGVEWFAKKYGKGYNKVMHNATDYQIGDVVVGKTTMHEFAICKVHSNFLPMLRTEIGFDVATFTEIYGVWRPEGN